MAYAIQIERDAAGQIAVLRMVDGAEVIAEYHGADAVADICEAGLQYGRYTPGHDLPTDAHLIAAICDDCGLDIPDNLI